MSAYAHESSCACGLQYAPDARRARHPAKLAHDAEIDRSYMSSLERQANPTIDLLDRIAETLDVLVSEPFVRPCKGAPPLGTLP